jgi:cytochrome c oxidase assembly protein subunit 15
MRWLHRYACLLAAATLLLVVAGGMVTSTNSGLSVPDWPTTYGYQMFSFPLSGMVGGIFYEHGHRLIASTVGLLTIGLVIILARVEQRRWVRRLGWAALGAVVAQGVLGGLTVIFLLPDAISISHAGLAEVFFCLTVSLALFTSRTWIVPAAPPVDDGPLRRRSVALGVLVYAQILAGATMRHTGAGLAIPDFPLSYGHLLPPFWTAPIAIHFTHRVGAVLVATLIFANALRIWRRHRDRPELTRPALLLVAGVVMQIALGGLVVLSGKQPVVNTAHLATGAVILVTSVFLALRTFRVRFGNVGPGDLRAHAA